MGIDSRGAGEGQTPRDNVDIGDGTPDRQVNRSDKTNNPNGQRESMSLGAGRPRKGRQDDRSREEQDPTHG
jgi:hypothetical protein